MRVKHDHPNTTEFSQQGQQSPASNISEELESRFNNALKPMPSEAEHSQETTRLYKAALSLDKFEPLKPKAQPDHLQQKKAKDQASSEKTDKAGSTNGADSSDSAKHAAKANLSPLEKDSTLGTNHQASKDASNSDAVEQPKTATEAESDITKPVKPNSLVEQAIGDKERIKHENSLHNTGITERPSKDKSPAENNDKDAAQSLSEKAPLSNMAGKHAQQQEEIIVKNQSVGSSATKEKTTRDNQADSAGSTASLDGLYHDPKAIIGGFQKDLNSQPTPIQLDGKAATAVQNVLNGQRQKPDTTTKEAGTLSNAQTNAEAKAALSAFEEKLKHSKHIDLHHSTPEADTKLFSASNISQPTTQGDVILKSMEAQAPQSSARDVNELISKLVDKIYVSLPSANEKEVRLLLNEGQLKGGEISIKHDSSGYSVLIKQEHALSLINQNAKQELVERLQRLGIDQPIRISVSEQMNQQQDQQRSRQQRSIYDEWKPEDER
ncbi:TPA: type III secretion system needle length determinant [Vibrio harveyi]|uniref:type III secretion system needle length determinant n=1 Tax=Vibrio harveyi TaxID=669 RepID=UPI003908D39A